MKGGSAVSSPPNVANKAPGSPIGLETTPLSEAGPATSCPAQLLSQTQGASIPAHRRGPSEAAAARLQWGTGGDNSHKYTSLPKYFSRKPKYLDGGEEKECTFQSQSKMRGEAGSVCPE